LLARGRAVITAPTPSRDILMPVCSRRGSASSDARSLGRTERVAWSCGVAAVRTPSVASAAGGPVAGAVAAVRLAPAEGWLMRESSLVYLRAGGARGSRGTQRVNARLAAGTPLHGAKLDVSTSIRVPRLMARHRPSRRDVREKFEAQTSVRGADKSIGPSEVNEANEAKKTF